MPAAKSQSDRGVRGAKPPSIIFRRKVAVAVGFVICVRVRLPNPLIAKFMINSIKLSLGITLNDS